MDYKYPLLKKVFSYYKNQTNKIDVNNTYLVCCQHLLEPQLKMFELFIDFGFDPKKIIVLAKMYSTNKIVFNKLKRTGILAIKSAFFGNYFDKEHKNNCQKVVNLIPKNARIIVLDDGADLIKAFIKSPRKVDYAVEQTSSGFRKLEKSYLPFPVINVARSATKLIQESPLVANLCFKRISGYIKNNKIKKPTILIVGLGPIGKSTLIIFKERGFIVLGFDIKHGHHNLMSFILKNKPDIIIGATGSNILSEKDIRQINLSKPLHLISISSSDREFSVAPFRNNINNTFENVVYKNIIFVNNGFPITFMGHQNELSPKEMEKTICLLCGSIIGGFAKKPRKKGLVNVPSELEKLIN